MRIYTSCVEMLEETYREIWKRGQTIFDKTVQGKIVSEVDFEQKELIFYNFRVDSFEDISEMLEKAKNMFNKEHLEISTANEWLNDMLSNKTLHEKWWDLHENTKEYFKQFCNESCGNASYSYGERLYNQTGWLIKRLRDNIYSRGAVLTMLNEKDASRIGRRIPCTMTYHFFARPTVDGNKLNLIVNMRSADAINFFPLDFARATLFLKHITEEINKQTPVKVGYVIMNVNSLHVYKKDLPEVYRW